MYFILLVPFFGGLKPDQPSRHGRAERGLVFLLLLVALALAKQSN
jgi:hypothetical protein